MPSQITLKVAEKLLERDRFGQKKYGTSLDRTDLSVLDWLRHAQEEAMDFAGYLEVLIQRAGAGIETWDVCPMTGKKHLWEPEKDQCSSCHVMTLFGPDGKLL